MITRELIIQATKALNESARNLLKVDDSVPTRNAVAIAVLIVETVVRLDDQGVLTKLCEREAQ